LFSSFTWLFQRYQIFDFWILCAGDREVHMQV
jgi:hypothetical protein